MALTSARETMRSWSNSKMPQIPHMAIKFGASAGPMGRGLEALSGFVVGESCKILHMSSEK